MLLLRSLRARLLIIGVVPVLVALFVTAALTVRSLSSFSDTQREERRAQRVSESSGPARATNAASLGERPGKL